jgi:hypothetical protein
MVNNALNIQVEQLQSIESAERGSNGNNETYKDKLSTKGVESSVNIKMSQEDIDFNTL